jgi:hypothetical protein
LLGVLGKTIHFQKKNRGITTHIEGIYPKDIGHSEIVRDLGIVKELDADRKHRLNADVTQQIIFRRERYSTSRGSAHANDDQNKTSQDFVTFINDCLAQALGKQLQEEKRRILKSCISELLDNAERHAIDTSQGKWYIRGHVNFAHSSPACEIAIFNFGKTVLETYEGLPDDHFSLKMHIKPYINKHMHVEGLTDESLTMVASLQPRVSCRNIDERNTCGTGTAELLDFFQNMCEAIVKCGSSDKNIAKPEMVLISGSAWLTFDEKYRLVKSIDENGHEKFLYPFNNSAEGLSVSPDPECVKTFTDGYFPGFMINIRFPLDIQTVV